MSDELKRLYEAAGKLKYYFDEKTPCDLYRGQSRSESKEGLTLLHPNPGFKRRDGSMRLPDVKVEDRNGVKWVKGCRSLQGDYRGISTFDRPNPSLVSFKWHILAKGSAIPEALAVTQDSDIPGKTNHFTIAPKDDMTLDLFLVWLKQLSSQMKAAD